MTTELTKGEATRQRIVALAAELFNQRGYAGCSIQDIMAATGLEKGGIYRHFDSKEELAAEAFDYAWATISAVRGCGLDSIADPATRLKQHFANFLLSPSPILGGCPLLNTAMDADDGNPVLRERVQNALCAWKTAIANAVEQGMRSGTFRSGLDSRAIANQVIGTLEGSIVLSRIERNDQPLRQAVARLTHWVDSDLTTPARQ